MLRLFVFLLVAAFADSSTAGGTQQPTAALVAETLDGRKIAPLSHSGQLATLLLFLSVDCPISNKYAPEIRRLHQQYVEKGIRFWLVYAEEGASSAPIKKHLADFNLPDRALIDVQSKLATWSKATVTPEAALFDPKGNLLYRGRIDDRFVSLGVERPAPTAHDLKEAIESFLANRPIIPSQTQAIGCRLSH